MPDHLWPAVSAALDDEVIGAARLGGGDVAEAFRVELTSGRTVFAKTHRDPPDGFFTTEATGLRWLRDTDAVRLPQVLAVADRPVPFLVLEWIDETHRRAGSDGDQFGVELARLHQAGASLFGRPDGRTTGSRALPNEPCPTWAEFFAHRRLEPLLRLATDQSALPSNTLTLVTRVIERIDDLAGPPEPPSLLHGDLWAGNRLVDREGHSWLIDPASFGGHREFDLAMMRLFGGFGDAEFGAYHQTAPLADGWQDRVPLWQLAPLMVHAIRFGGGGYAAATERAVSRALRADGFSR